MWSAVPSNEACVSDWSQKKVDLLGICQYVKVLPGLSLSSAASATAPQAMPAAARPNSTFAV